MLNRRRFLKYAGATAAVVGASALGLDSILKSSPITMSQTTLTTQETSTSLSTTSSVIPLTSTSSVQPSSLSGRLFFDYNGNGIQDAQEPVVSNAKVGLTDGTGGMIAESLTGPSGDYTFENAPVGSYLLKVDADKKFRYMCRSANEFRGISDGYPLVLNEPSKLDVGLMEGFLTWPFPAGTRFTRDDYLGRDSVVDIGTLTGGPPRAYDPSIPTVCSGSVCVQPGHFGIDIGVNVGTHFVAAAPLKITQVSSEPGKNGKQVGLIWVAYIDGIVGYYAHAQLLPNIKIGQEIPRGQEFGYVEESDVGASHLHFQSMKDGRPIDPYADLLNKDSLCYWTEYNNPQFP